MSKLFVDGFDDSITEDDIFQVFKKHGYIMEVAKYRNRGKHGSGYFAFVVYNRFTDCFKVAMQDPYPIIKGQKCRAILAKIKKEFGCKFPSYQKTRKTRLSFGSYLPSLRKEAYNLTVHGYINAINELTKNVPLAIYDMIETFYTRYDIWGYIDSNLEIKDDLKIVHKSGIHATWSNAFSYQSFWKGIIRFEVQINGSHCFIGVIPTDNIIKNTGCALSNKLLRGSIGYWDYDGSILNGTNGDKRCYAETYGDNDRITIILDFEKYLVRFEKNGFDQGSLPIQRNTAYSFGVSVCYTFGVQYVP